MGLLQPVAVLLIISAIGTTVATAIMWPRRHSTVAAAGMTATMIGLTWWSTARATSVLVPGLDLKLAFESAVYPGIGVSTAGYLCYALGMVDPTWRLPRRTALLLCVEPVLATVASATNPWHYFFLSSAGLSGDPAQLATEPGPGLWLHTAYNYALLAWSVWSLIKGRLASPSVYRAHFTWGIVAFIPPMIANLVIMFVFGARVVGLTPVFFSATAGACCWALFHRALPDLVPVASRQVFETIGDAVVVVDRHQRVLDLNPAALRLLRRLHPKMTGAIIGTPLSELLGSGKPLDALAGAERTLHLPDGTSVDFQVRFSPLSREGDEPVGWVLVAHDVTERNRQREDLRAKNTALREQLVAVERLRSELAELAVRDPLTGLHNRRHLMATLTADIAHARAGRQPLSVVLLDIDHFKSMNDRFGHAAGDQVIVAAGDRLAQSVRPRETAARYGGEEFLLVLPGTAGISALHRAEAVRRRIADTPVTAGDTTTTVTISAGVAVLGVADTAETLIEAADRAMYEAKSLGRNRVVAAQPLLIADSVTR